MSDDVLHLDATAQAALIAAGEISPVELVGLAIDAARRLDPQLNAVVHERYEEALADAAAADLPDGPFRGVPFVEKDLDGFAAGQPYHGGNRHLRDHGYVAEQDSHLHERFVAAGLVTIARTNTPELGLQPTTESLVYGPAHNPWDLERSTGGSSGGSAACVAARVTAMGHAGDGGGSIRIPASMCGLVGLKPSRGRHSLGPHVAESWGGLVTRLAVTRSVRDTAALLDAVEGAMPGDPYAAPPPRRPFLEEVGADPGRLRVGVATVSPDPAVHTDARVAAAVSGAGELMAELGHDVVASHPEVWDDADAGQQLTAAFTDAYTSWIASDIDHLGELTGVPVTAEGCEPATWLLAEMGQGVSATRYLAALETLGQLTRRLARWWDHHDVLVTPVIPEPPFVLGQFAATDDDPLVGLARSAQIVPFTVPFNISGQPAISLPLATTDDGLPIGVQLVAGYGREDQLLAVAAQLEEARPWVQRRPPVCV